MNRRQTEGRETWRRLLEWDRGQAASERLAAQILRNEGYESIDPSHPLGGRDGLKDIICVKDKVKFVAASFFSRGKQTFSKIKNKYNSDIEGVAKNNASGIVFVTNQELTLSQREELNKESGGTKVDLFHLERISSILDSPQCYGIRLEFLDIEMTGEEQLSFIANIVNPLNSRLDELLSIVKQSDSFRKDDTVRKAIDKILARQKTPDYVATILIDNHCLCYGNRLKSCSQCGYGYVVRGASLGVSGMVTALERSAASCPKCGNAEYV